MFMSVEKIKKRFLIIIKPALLSKLQNLSQFLMPYMNYHKYLNSDLPKMQCLKICTTKVACKLSKNFPTVEMTTSEIGRNYKQCLQRNCRQFIPNKWCKSGILDYLRIFRALLEQKVNQPSLTRDLDADSGSFTLKIMMFISSSRILRWRLCVLSSACLLERIGRIGGRK